jgi:hypothetical protein
MAAHMSNVFMPAPRYRLARQGRSGDTKSVQSGPKNRHIAGRSVINRKWGSADRGTISSVDSTPKIHPVVVVLGDISYIEPVAVRFLGAQSATFP